MTESTQFRVVLRGYEPAQVDRRLEELSIAVHEAARQRDDLLHRLSALEEARARQGLEEAWPEPATYEHLGERIVQMLTLAEAEAAAIKQRGAQEINSMQAELSELAGRIRAEADRYAASVRGDAETDAARIIEDARQVADERMEGAEREAAARIQEAEAIYEEQRARSAMTAADFESTLASRRKAAEAEFTQSLEEANARLEESHDLVDRARVEAERLTSEAAHEARRIIEHAELQASTIVSDAKTMAARVRADSERELSAATQRRDSINAQLANVRQMLATLTGTTPTFDGVEMPGQAQPEHDLALLEGAD